MTHGYFNGTTSIPPLGANPDTITISGFSSGSFMSTHMHVIFSDIIKGAGCMAGGPYHGEKMWNVTDTAEQLAWNGIVKAWYNYNEGEISNP